MMLSELCVVSVSLPASVAQGQKGVGAVLKFRFSPYKQIEFLRVAILKVNTCTCMWERKRGGGEKTEITEFSLLVMPN